MAEHHDAKIWAVLGASGSGKGAWLKQWLTAARPYRLMIWDPLDEYGGHAARVSTAKGLIAAVLKGTFRVRYVPRGTDKDGVAAEFAFFCACAYAAGKLVCIVEELSLVTSPSYAPPAWAKLSNMGRHRGLHLVGVSQFPAQIDKSFLANATVIHTGVLRNARHRKAVAEEMDIDPADIGALAPMHWIERSGTGEITRGVVKFRQKRAAKPPADAPTTTPDSGSNSGDAVPVQEG